MIAQQVYEAFRLKNISVITALSEGLINSSYKVSLTGGDKFFLQKINTRIFNNAEDVQYNYSLIQQHINKKKVFDLPAAIYTTDNKLIFNYNGDAWRCMQFIENTYSPLVVQTPEKAFETANCFGRFTAAMQDVDSQVLKTILPGFHDLSYRYYQLTDAVKNADAFLLKEAKELLSQVEEFNYLLRWYQSITSDKRNFPLHIMHHDCKIANILFRKQSDELICPVDFDTTQPGLFFSDVGDMVRTIVSNTTENNANLNEIEIRPLFYKAVMEGYTVEMQERFTKMELQNLVYAGGALVYMQAIRFLADYLNGNVYYKTEYQNQNKYRAANQLTLLRLLESFRKNLKF